MSLQKKRNLINNQNKQLTNVLQPLVRYMKNNPGYTNIPRFRLASKSLFDNFNNQNINNEINLVKNNGNVPGALVLIAMLQKVLIQNRINLYDQLNDKNVIRSLTLRFHKTNDNRIKKFTFEVIRYVIKSYDKNPDFARNRIAVYTNNNLKFYNMMIHDLEWIISLNNKFKHRNNRDWTNMLPDYQISGLGLYEFLSPYKQLYLKYIREMFHPSTHGYLQLIIRPVRIDNLFVQYKRYFNDFARKLPNVANNNVDNKHIAPNKLSNTFRRFLNNNRALNNNYYNN